MKPRRNWFVRKAKLADSRCWICKQVIVTGESIVKYGGKRWPHFTCAKGHDARICTERTQ